MFSASAGRRIPQAAGPGAEAPPPARETPGFRTASRPARRRRVLSVTPLPARWLRTVRAWRPDTAVRGQDRRPGPGRGGVLHAPSDRLLAVVGPGARLLLARLAEPVRAAADHLGTLVGVGDRAPDHVCEARRLLHLLAVEPVGVVGDLVVVLVLAGAAQEHGGDALLDEVVVVAAREERVVG